MAGLTEALPELAMLPPGLVLDGELVAFHDGRQDFPRLCERMLHPLSTNIRGWKASQRFSTFRCANLTTGLGWLPLPNVLPTACPALWGRADELLAVGGCNGLGPAVYA